MTDPIDLSEEAKHFNQRVLAGLGVPAEFLSGDSNHATSHASPYAKTVKTAQRLGASPPRRMKRKPYRKNVTKNAKKQHRKDLKTYLKRTRFARYSARFIRAKLGEESFARQIFRVDPPLPPEPRFPRTARERRWWKYHPNTFYPWEKTDG